MTIAEIQQKILTSDEFVMEEAYRIRKLYGLREVIRYNRTRTEKIYSQSVAEHTFNMQVLAQYFLPLEDDGAKLDAQRIFKMITWHDIGEIESGDVIGFSKTAQDKANDAAGNEKVVSETSEVLQNSMRTLIEDYESQRNPESKFVKAIDKVEVVFEILDENYREVFKINKTTTEHSNKSKYPYVNDYPYIKRFTEVVSAYLTKEGYFIDKPYNE